MIRDALAALPIHFRSDTFIEGISATDIFTLSSALGATIENQFVDTLNQIRNVWDSKHRYETFSFVRQPQTFPDVVLADSSSDQKPIMGIELKGWYLLSKEGEPSFRFTQTPAACAEADLIVVVPWTLSNVISGRPKIFAPFTELARYAAEYRNHHWQHQREAKGNAKIINPLGISPYPGKNVQSTDAPAEDKGGNFGRFARTGLMDSYLEAVKSRNLCGIKAKYWLEFFKVFQEHATDASVKAALERLKHKALADQAAVSRHSATTECLLRIIGELERLVIGAIG